MPRCTILVLASIIVSTQAVSYFFDTISKTINGSQCLTNCVNNRCIINYDLVESPCIPGSVKAPLYYTSLFRSKRKFCLSACGHFGWEYEWCIISDNKKEWDYCSSAPRENTLVRRAQFTLNEHLCMDACQLDQNNRYSCTTSWKEKLECDPNKKKDYVQMKTSLDHDCVGLCSNAQNVTYLWCYYGHDSTPDNKKWFLCAPPVSRRKHLFNTNIYTFEFEVGDNNV